MSSDVRVTVGKSRFLGIITGAMIAAFSVGCTTPEEAPFCPLAQQSIESGASGVYFVQRGAEPAVVLTGGNGGIACHMLTADGQIGERFCEVRYVDEDPNNPLPFAYGRGMVLGDNHVAAYTSHYVARADFTTDHATPTLLQFDVGVENAQLAHLFAQPDGLYGIWTSANADGTTTAGLAQVGTDDVVRAVGAPFFNGKAAEGENVFFLLGAYDRAGDRFLVDNLDGVTLVELDRNGNLLASTPHGEASGTGAATRLTDWTQISMGQWVGLNGGWLCNFEPRDRSTETCVRIQFGNEPPPGHADPMALNADASGSLWAWFRVTQPFFGSALGRFDGNNRFDGPVVPLRLDTCDWILYAQ